MDARLGWMDAKAKTFIERQFAHAPLLQKEIMDLWSTFRDLGLPNRDFLAEFTNGKKPSLAQRTWEMMLARHLAEVGHEVTCPNGGPDFRFSLDGVTVWVEAVSPEPKGLPADWLDPDFQGVQDFPHEAILLRWTTAIDAKWKKLAEYRSKGVVAPNDAYVVAVSGNQLGLIPVDRGISQMPFGVEATFPVGPLAYRIDPETHKIGDGFIWERFHIVNANRAKVPTTSFLDPAYAGISALIGCGAQRPGKASVAMHVVHNPLAETKLPLGSLGAGDDEWWPSPVADKEGEFDLHRPKPDGQA
ncbi:hypothetical protein A5906_26240 [Bradyrhizobium sacchari]|uniref:Uncharacterized protein n=1 Tax=Bradyrhizobium sacchari TaxID=1399419 RepID=A0A560K678_9BRAD|nr:hypothetical protein [Bradyrhizobium sacchari]OPY99232.1 hypothetical protein A5906_26240 [Bradyrhizobium sacchari]TWB62960.1 hypothetical protein FBZ94_103660 [Bradyrhizobium sacchari]TWB76110.1 hypothetical protein FBZ95_104290 [Bradyrhizobium sacchari]